MFKFKKKSEKLVAWPFVRKIAFFHLLRQIIVQPLFTYCKISLADSVRIVNRELKQTRRRRKRERHLKM